MLDHIKRKLELYINSQNIGSKLFKIQIAYSGGLDSSCMLHALMDLKIQYNLDLFLTYINYHTSEYSNDVQDYIEEITLEKSKKNICHAKISRKENFESVARKIRYKVLKELHEKNSIDLTFTAHHLNDQIETVIMKFINGSDYVSLQGIRPKYGFIARPILDLDKKMIIDYSKKNNIIYFEDPTNKDLSYARNKVRKFIAPYFYSDKFLINKINKINISSIKKFEKIKTKINRDLMRLNYNQNFKYVFVLFKFKFLL